MRHAYGVVPIDDALWIRTPLHVLAQHQQDHWRCSTVSSELVDPDNHKLPQHVPQLHLDCQQHITKIQKQMNPEQAFRKVFFSPLSIVADHFWEDVDQSKYEKKMRNLLRGHFLVESLPNSETETNTML